MGYKVIYTFEVLNKIIEGKNVGMTDRGDCDVRSVNDMTVEEFAGVLRDFEETKGRYEFWMEEQEDEA